MLCRICNAATYFSHRARILGKYFVSYYSCTNCGFLQTEDPYWLDEAYQESINLSDTGILSRNLDFARASSVILYWFFERDGKFLDYGGGTGIYVRLMRDIGFDFYWRDSYTRNLFARGFEGSARHYELITSFETFEHFVYPAEEINGMLGLSDSILFSTELYGDKVPPANEWDYYGLHHGQHVGFYSMKTLRFISEKYHLSLWSNGRMVHLFTRKKIQRPLIFVGYQASRLGLSLYIKMRMKTRTKLDSEMLINRA